jgi:hypothetical protein
VKKWEHYWIDGGRRRVYSRRSLFLIRGDPNAP